MIRSIIIDMTAWAMAGVWLDHKIASSLVQRIAYGRYGFKPTMAYVNDALAGKPIGKALPPLLKRLDVHSIGDLALGSENIRVPPLCDLSFTTNRRIPCYVSLELAVKLENNILDEVDQLIEYTQFLIEDSKAEYATAHEARNNLVLSQSRRGDFLMLRSCSRGAYWLTYFCNEYVKRLGGEKKLKAAPAWQVRKLPNGIMLISHPDPRDLDKAPKSSDIQRLHEYLQSLVPLEDKP